jgi:hypothetical protein
VTIWQAQGVVTAAADRFVGVGAGWGVRSLGRLGLGITANVGDADGSLGARVEAVTVFHFNPFRRRGVGGYGAGGVAVVATDSGSREFLVLLMGLEARPGRRYGWFVEAGVGGGVRVSAGIRLRRFPPRR